MSSPHRSGSSATSEGGPVKVRAYGLFPFTRRGYMIVQTCCFTALLAAMAWLAIAPPDTAAYRKLAASAPPADRLPIELFAKALDHALVILAVILVLGALETAWMLRRFRMAETRRGKPSG